MNPGIVGLILIGCGIGALIKEFLTDGDKNVKDSGNRSSGGGHGKQDPPTATNPGRDRIVINNVYDRPKKKKLVSELDNPPKKESKKDVKQSSIDSEVDSE